MRHVMAGYGSNLNRKQENAILALLSHRSIEDAAKAAAVGTRTLMRWLKDPAFGRLIWLLAG
jgi:transposase-like protein